MSITAHAESCRAQLPSDGEAKQDTTEAYKCREMGPPIPPVEPAITGARRTPAMPAAAPCCFVSVTKSDSSLVGPAEATPGGALPLSSIDRIYFKNLIQETVHVFTRGGREAARVVREALSRSLVHYYPMAGRLVRPDSEGGVAHVACTGEGAWFVEATASCTLEDVDWLQQHPLPIPAEELFPCPSDTAGMIMMIQVTQFTCGGFVIGLRTDHALCDGLGIGQFLNAVAEMARGLEHPTVKAVWSREAIPSPSQRPRSKAPRPPTPLQTLIMDVSLDHIVQLRDQCANSSSCSKFELLIAKLWQCRTRAIGLGPGAVVHLRIAANVRHLLKDVLPPGGGYYGNCVYPLMVSAPSDKIERASIVEIAGLIKDVKKSLPAEFSKWLAGELKDEPYSTALTMGYELLIVSDWTRVGFSEVDYGWGGPAYVAPVMMPPDSDRPPTCYIVKPVAPVQGFRLMTRLVKEEHVEAFQQQMKSLAVVA